MESTLSMVAGLFGELWTVWKGMFSFFLELFKRFFVLFLWILCGIIVLPCVFVAGTFYPKWSEWGEKL